MTWAAVPLPRGRRTLLAAPLEDAPGMAVVTDRDRPRWAVVRLARGPFRDAASFERTASRATDDLFRAAPFATADPAPRRHGRRSLLVHLGSTCNLHCAHCYILARSASATAVRLPAAQLLAFVEQLVPRGLAEVVLSGGEPLLHPELKTIVGGCRARGLAVALRTNATAMSSDLAKWLAEADVEVTASLHGPDAATHDRLAGAGSFAEATLGMERLVRHLGRARLQVNSTLWDGNVGVTEDTIRRAAGLGARAIRFLPLHGAQKGGLRLDHEGESLLAWASRAAAGIVAEAYSITVRPGMSARPGATPSDVGHPSCEAGSSFVISPEGDLFPCTLLMEPQDRLGAAGDEPAASWAALAPLARTLRARPARIAACRACLLRGICRGGCAALARQVHGTMLATDPLCAANIAYARAWFTALALARGA